MLVYAFTIPQTVHEPGFYYITGGCGVLIEKSNQAVPLSSNEVKLKTWTSTASKVSQQFEQGRFEDEYPF